MPEPKTVAPPPTSPLSNVRTGRPDFTPRGGRGHVTARTIGALTPRVTKVAFQKFGFATAQLIADWPGIVGERLAATTAPDRIRWPRRPGDPAAGDDAGAAAGPRSAATLVIRVEPAVALDVQYKTALILDRINAYFGYRAVAELRIVQGAVAASPKTDTAMRQSAPRARADTPAPVSLAGITDDGLKAALEKMQIGLRSRRR